MWIEDLAASPRFWSGLAILVIAIAVGYFVSTGPGR
jgi:hypothetical protein